MLGYETMRCLQRIFFGTIKQKHYWMGESFAGRSHNPKNFQHYHNHSSIVSRTYQMYNCRLKLRKYLLHTVSKLPGLPGLVSK